MDVDSEGKILPDGCTSMSYLDSLFEPFLGIARKCIPLDNKDVLAPASERADTLEISLRLEMLDLCQEASNGGDDAAIEDVGAFWKTALKLCIHFVYYCDQGSDDRYKGMSVRKLPLLLLEDALDSLPLDSFKTVWESHVEPAFPILFSKVMWHPTSKSTPCALPFIKLCNKFLRKLYVQKGPWPGRILLTLASTFPLSDKSATKMWGSFNVENVTEYETKAQFENQQEEQNLKMEGNNNEVLHSHNKQQQSYSFYETFWSVQQDFSNPSAIKVAEFLERMRSILAALESHRLIRCSKGGEDESSANVRVEVKYLTSSHLLPIQLGDPEFRIHFLTQFLIVENHLSSESPALGNAMAPLQKRAKDLLKHIQPHGSTHLNILDFILSYREKYWRQWKKNKCQPDMETPFVVEDEQSGIDVGKKRKRLMDGPLSGNTSAPKTAKKKDEEELLIDFILNEKKDLKATCALPAHSSSESMTSTSCNTRSKIVPSLEVFMNGYVGALDPESGIEAEYHPKNDSLFTWRAVRLLSRSNLGMFHMINHKGDFEKMVRHIWAKEKGIQIPGEAPAEEPSITAVESTEHTEERGKTLGKDAIDDDEMQEQHTEENLKNEGTRPRSDSQATTSHEETGSRAVKDEITEEADEDDSGRQIDAKEKGAQSTAAPLDSDSSSKEEILSDDAIEDEPSRVKDEPIIEEGSDDDSDDEPSRFKEEIIDSDEGEIEESKDTKKKTTHLSPSPSPVEDDIQKEKPSFPVPQLPSKSERERSHESERGRSRESERGRSHDNNRQTDQREEERGSSHQNRQGHSGRGHRAEDQRHQHGRPSSPTHRFGGGRGSHRDRTDGSSGYINYGDSRDNRDHGRPGPPRNQRGGGGGGDSHQRGGGDGHQRGGGGNRDYGPPGGGRRGGPAHDQGGGGGGGRRDDRRPPDDRWDDRRGGGGGGSGGGGRREDRRGDRRGGDRRGGGRGDGRNRRRH